MRIFGLLGLSLLSLLLLNLSACGKKAPLTLPDDTPKTSSHPNK